MISKEPRYKLRSETLLSHQEAISLMDRGAKRAIETSWRMGVPIPLGDRDGTPRFELPEGTVAEGDPWNGMRTAPEGWYERFDIPIEDRTASPQQPRQRRG